MSELAEATDRELKTIPGVGDKMIKPMKEALSLFFKDYVMQDIIAGMPEDWAPSQRIAYAALIEEAELYSYSLNEIRDAIMWLPEKERIFLEMNYGLKGEKFSDLEIASKLHISGEKLKNYKTMIINHLVFVLKQ